MKSILFALALTLLIVATSRPVAAFSIDDILDFKDFFKFFNKTYIGEEFKKREAIFKKNLANMVLYNLDALKSDIDSRLGVSEFSDLEAAEFLATYTGFNESGQIDNSGIVSINTVSKLAISSLASTPSSKDWRNDGIVNYIKNQGQCGSCWTFSITSAIESAYAKRYGSLPRLSEQELLDCVTSSSYGCNGGSPKSAASFAVSYGLMPSSQYPYVAKKKSCGYVKKSVTAKPYSAYLWKGSEDGLTTIVSKYGPVSVVIYASSSFQNYKKGVFYDKYCLRTSSTNHAVTIVGYGRENGKNYWLIRNQWGTNWGEKGYFKLYRGSNHCNVMTQPIYFVF